MSLAANYQDVLDQITGYGLEVTTLEPGALRRVKAEGDRGKQKSGWYSLHELRAAGGDVLLVGAYGCWRNGGGAQKVALKGHALTDDERAAIKARIANDRRQAEAGRKALAERAARRAAAAWDKFSESGECEYLARKRVAAYGVRFSARGNLVAPIHDVHGRIHGLQVIYGDASTKKIKGRDKDFWPSGMEKRGHFFLIGAVSAPDAMLLIAEGYATGASLHAATGWAVAVAFDAGNLLPVAENLRRHYRRARILVCADDDFATPGNPGASAAAAAALAVGGVWVQPDFGADPVRADVSRAISPAGADMPASALREVIAEAVGGRAKLTDFNDLHAAQGLMAVRAQLESAAGGLLRRGAGFLPREAPSRGDGGGGKMRPIASLDEMEERFALVYGHGSTVFDFSERILLSLSDMRDACIRRELHRDWMQSPQKKIVRIREVGFDPGGQDEAVVCNLWGGWPTQPVAGKCERLLELLEYLCNHEDNSRELYQWVLRWIAYPIQNPGAKMKTALVLHGPQGVGKNMLFESVMAIYGEYGRVIDQSAVEDKFNDWASKKLFLIADEVVARQELYHVKGKLKGLITGDWIRINPKNVTPYDERNHVNIVFLSNETQPLILDKDDRRYTVIWTPPELSAQYYAEVKQEINEGGIAALHDYLLHLDMGGFRPHTRPPMTRAKADLIEMSIDSTERFVRAWLGGEMDQVPVLPCKSEDFYALYRAWCARAGIPKYAPAHILLGNAGKRSDMKKCVARYMNGAGLKQATFIFPRGQFDPPADKTQGAWLGECALNFRAGVDEWRGEIKDY